MASSFQVEITSVQIRHGAPFYQVFYLENEVSHSTMLFISMTTKTVECQTCKKEFQVSLKEYNRKIRENSLKFFCGRPCYFQSRTTCRSIERECEFCGKLFISTTRKKHQKCCSIVCARKYSQSHVDIVALSATMKRFYDASRKSKHNTDSTFLNSPSARQGPKLVELTCKVCGKSFQHVRKTKMSCSVDCQKILQRAGSVLGGRKSASSQKRRSRNEIMFYELCKNTFSDAINNEPMFNGWDAVIIIPSLKIAVLWNGVWHRKKITRKHSILQVQNRDAIKIREIQKCGYDPIIIDDDGGFDETFVKDEFSKFCGSVARRVKAASS